MSIVNFSETCCINCNFYLDLTAAKIFFIKVKVYAVLGGASSTPVLNISAFFKLERSLDTEIFSRRYLCVGARPIRLLNYNFIDMGAILTNLRLVVQGWAKVSNVFITPKLLKIM